MHLKVTWANGKGWVFFYAKDKFINENFDDKTKIKSEEIYVKGWVYIWVKDSVSNAMHFKLN
jgi:hypothetical protein